MARRRRTSWRRDQDSGTQAATPTGAQRRATTPATYPVSVQQARTLEGVQAALRRISRPVSVLPVLATAKPAQSTRPERARRKFGDAPQDLVTRHNAWITNNPASAASVALVQKVVKTMEDKGQIKRQVREPLASRATSSAESQALAQRGVKPPAATERANHACLSEHRPDPSKGSGGGSRDFVHWCKKGK